MQATDMKKQDETIRESLVTALLVCLADLMGYLVRHALVYATLPGSIRLL